MSWEVIGAIAVGVVIVALLISPERAFHYSNERRAPVKLIYAIAFAVSFVAAPVAASAQSLDLPLPSAQCTDDYYEDADGQCDALSAGEVLTIEAILAKYGIIIIRPGGCERQR